MQLTLHRLTYITSYETHPGRVEVWPSKVKVLSIFEPHKLGRNAGVQLQ